MRGAACSRTERKILLLNLSTHISFKKSRILCFIRNFLCLYIPEYRDIEKPMRPTNHHLLWRRTGAYHLRDRTEMDVERQRSLSRVHFSGWNRSCQFSLLCWRVSRWRWKSLFVVNHYLKILFKLARTFRRMQFKRKAFILLLSCYVPWENTSRTRF